MTKLTTEMETAFATAYEAARDKGASDLRAQAWEAFTQRGLPNRRVEAWHYTDLKAALDAPAPVAQGGVAPSLPRAHDAIRLSIFNGVFSSVHSDLAKLPPGVSALSLRDALAKGDAEIMAALASADIGADDAALSLNAALMQDGVVLRVAPGVTITRPIELCTATSAGQASFTRTLVLLGEGASATLIESASVNGQENHATVLRLGARATLTLATQIGAEAGDAVRVLSLLAHLAQGATLNAAALIEASGLTRRQIFARLDGDGAHVSFHGATLGRGRQHADTTLVVDHAQPHGASRERFRYVLDEQSTGVFQGKIIVRPGAQKTDGAMQSKALLLSDGATMNNKPELEIFADDVQCSHGATCGRLDGDQLFYLMARGLPRAEAEAMLIEAFANEAFADFEDEALRGFFAARISQWLARRVAA